MRTLLCAALALSFCTFSATADDEDGQNSEPGGLAGSYEEVQEGPTDAEREAMWADAARQEEEARARSAEHLRRPSYRPSGNAGGVMSAQ